jgi:hypothetical protein
MEKTCRNNCLYFSFTDDAGHYGSNWFCKAHGKRIKNADGFCDKHIDREKKSGVSHGLPRLKNRGSD